MCTFILVSSDQFTVSRSLPPSASKSNWTDLKKSTEEIRSTDCEIVSSLHLPTQRQVQVAMGCTHVCKETGNGLCLAFLYYQLVAKRKKKTEEKRHMSIDTINLSLIFFNNCTGGKTYIDPVGQMVTFKSWRIAFWICRSLSSHRVSVHYIWPVLTDDERVSVWTFWVIDKERRERGGTL